MKSEPKRVLVVEDECAIRESILIYLDHAGYQVEGAENGIEGLDCVRSSSFDLIILDMKMPYLDGHQFSRNLHDMAVHVPILVITAWDDHRPVLQEAGRLEKTFTLKQILAEVTRIIGAADSREQEAQAQSNPPAGK